MEHQRGAPGAKRCSSASKIAPPSKAQAARGCRMPPREQAGRRRRVSTTARLQPLLQHSSPTTLSSSYGLWPKVPALTGLTFQPEKQAINKSVGFRSTVHKKGLLRPEGSREQRGGGLRASAQDRAMHRRGGRKLPAPVPSSSLGCFLLASFPFTSRSRDTSPEFSEASSPPSGHTSAITPAKVFKGSLAPPLA